MWLNRIFDMFNWLKNDFKENLVQKKRKTAPTFFMTFLSIILSLKIQYRRKIKYTGWLNNINTVYCINIQLSKLGISKLLKVFSHSSGVKIFILYFCRHFHEYIPVKKISNIQGVYIIFIFENYKEFKVIVFLRYLIDRKWI